MDSGFNSSRKSPYPRSNSLTRRNGRFHQPRNNRDFKSDYARQRDRPPTRRHDRSSSRDNKRGIRKRDAYRSVSRSPDAAKVRKVKDKEISPPMDKEQKESSFPADFLNEDATAAVLCDRLITLRNLNPKERSQHVTQFESLFASSDLFYAEDRSGKPLSFAQICSKLFMDGPPDVQVTKRLFLEESEKHSFSLDFEHCNPNRDQIVLYEQKNGKFVRVYFFKDKMNYANPKLVLSLENFQKESKIYRDVLRYVCKKGITEDTEHHFYDYVNKPVIVG
ncbi:hypothetical protein IE077_002868 [Cardiosporidium cionae]|uniref:Uncharacterized protein n=1 Tax=Cardiosporidium cionae TaxID=476202 RepID=A0ABQ7J9Q3_9APIC|nr:hypothetical protein IE077_002868 [Cardiosporidium cionae]|eukprot:KAF8820719.1 hypothetical protein IE077_002868 [Cardiosporidium cionae]